MNLNNSIHNAFAAVSYKNNMTMHYNPVSHIAKNIEGYQLIDHVLPYF